MRGVVLDEVLEGCACFARGELALDDPRGAARWRALDHRLRAHLADEEDRILSRLSGIAPVETATLRAEHAVVRAELDAIARAPRDDDRVHARFARLRELVALHVAHEHPADRDRELALAALCDDADGACHAHDLRHLAELAGRLATYTPDEIAAHLGALAACCDRGDEYAAIVWWHAIATELTRLYGASGARSRGST